MATAYKVLGQSNPSAATLTTLYTCPASKETVISTIVVANQAGTSGTYRIAVRPNGAAIATEHYLVYEASISANSTVAYTIGITMDASDVLSIQGSSANFSFNAFGSEIS